MHGNRCSQPFSVIYGVTEASDVRHQRRCAALNRLAASAVLARKRHIMQRGPENAGIRCQVQGVVVLTPYGLDIIESCLACKMRAEHIFCDLPSAALQSFESMKYATAYPKGAVLFVEGQMPRGIFVLCKGRVKLSINSPSGRTVIVKLVEPGEVLGMSATI